MMTRRPEFPNGPMLGRLVKCSFETLPPFIIATSTRQSI
jgi:hypothetical protein